VFLTPADNHTAGRPVRLPFELSANQLMALSAEKHQTSADDRTVLRRLKSACQLEQEKVHMSNVTNAAVVAINEQRSAEAREKARRLILAIDQSNHVVKARTEGLEKLTAELKKLANDKYNAVEITGSMPATMGATTILETIAELNKQEQESVASRCTQLDASIRGEQAALEAETANRISLRQKLTEIKVETVSTETIGN
jgi:hypothetical protein